jgi:DNA-binding FrmR family transcriptional regulator
MTTAVSTNGHQSTGCNPPPEDNRLTQPLRGYASGKDDYLFRLRKIEGQVRGLQKMIEQDRWCPDIVTQVASTTRALQEVAVGLLNDHLQHCVMAAAKSSDAEGRARLDEVAATIRQVVRL